MKNSILIVCAVFLVHFVSIAQHSETDSLDIKDVQESYVNPVNFKVGDSIKIKRPASSEYLFIHKKDDKKEKVKKKSKLIGAVGRGIGAVGIGSRNMEILSTGTKISNTIGILDSAIEISDLLPQGLNDLQVSLTDVQTVNLNGLETLIGEFSIKKKVYIVQLTNALYSNEISAQ